MDEKKPEGFLRECASLRIVPLILFIVFPVLLVRLHYVAVPSDATRLWADSFVGDTRSWWKAVAVVGCGIWMAGGLVLMLFTGWRPHFPLYAGLLAMAAVTTALSALLSEYPYTAWLGYVTAFEGTFVLLAYCISAWYAAEAVDTGKMRLLAIRVIGGVGIVNAVHGIAEGFGLQFWRTGMGRWVMGAAGVENVLFRFSSSRMAYGTVFQPNHFGMLMAVIAALAAAMVFTERTTVWRFFWGMTLAAALSAAVFSNSRAGILVSLTIPLIYLLRTIRKNLRSKTGRMSASSSRRRINRLLFLLPAAPFVLLACAPETRAALVRLVSRFSPSPLVEPYRFQVEAIGLENDRIEIRLNDKELFLWKSAPSSWRIARTKHSRGEALLFRNEDSGWKTATLADVADGFVRWRPEGNIRLQAPGTHLKFYSVGREIYAVDEVSEQLRSRVALTAYEPNGFEGAMSGRGYIWRHVYPMLKKAPWFGHGPGSFALVFPNDDLLNRQRFGQGINEDKGHGIWAMLLVQLGGIGFLLYSLPTAYVLWRMRKGEGVLRTPLFLGMAAFLCCALTNDSTVGVTPIYCVLLGLALGDASTMPDLLESC